MTHVIVDYKLYKENAQNVFILFLWEWEVLAAHGTAHQTIGASSSMNG